MMFLKTMLYPSTRIAVDYNAVFDNVFLILYMLIFLAKKVIFVLKKITSKYIFTLR